MYLSLFLYRHQLLNEHQQQMMLIFTAHNRFAYRIARLHLVPVITHQTKAAERKAILDDFRNGNYRVIVTTKVLNEGIDIPEAKIVGTGYEPDSETHPPKYRLLAKLNPFKLK